MLRRTRVGAFDLESAFTLDALEKLCHRGGVSEGLLPVETALDDIPVFAASDQETIDLKHGRAIALPLTHNQSELSDQPNWVLAMNNDIAIALCDAQDGILSPKRVFNM